MAVCRHCNRDMLTADGCIKVPIIHKSKEYTPIRYGDEAWWGETGNTPTDRCHDCNAMIGQYHHPGCDMERCPVCGGQLISCGCIDTED